MFNKLFATILSLLFMFVTPNIVWGETEQIPEGATHLARVIAPRAIVYSDENMNSPLGYISNGRLVTVGNPRKKNPDLVPLVVYGRLAFIEVKNLQYENDSLDLSSSKRGAPREHNIDVILEKPEEKLSENNSVFIDLHQFGGGEDTKNLFMTHDNVDKSNYTGIGLSLLHRKTNSRLTWGAGYEFNSISSSNVNVKIYMLRGILGYTPFRSSLFLVDIDGSLDMSITTQLNIENNFTTEPYGFTYGPSAKIKAVFFPENRYHVFGSLGLRSYRVIGIKEVETAGGAKVPGLTKISGVDLGIGLAIEL